MSFLHTVTDSKQNWIGLEINVPERIAAEGRAWKDLKFTEVHSIPGEKDECPYHITVSYGFDPKDYDEVKKMVEKENIRDTDFMYGDAYSISPPHDPTKMFVCAHVICPKLDALKMKVEERFKPKNPAAANGRVIPLHVTLKTLALPIRSRDWHKIVVISVNVIIFVVATVFAYKTIQRVLNRYDVSGEHT